MQILSIDDSKTIRQTIQNLIEVIGVKFLQAEDGEKGLAKIIQIIGIANLEDI